MCIKHEEREGHEEEAGAFEFRLTTGVPSASQERFFQTFSLSSLHVLRALHG